MKPTSSSPAAFPPITFAFQPIVDIHSRTILSFEALVRGPANESACSVFDQVDPQSLPLFDQACRVAAIELAVTLGLPHRLNLNIIPNDFASPEVSIRTTVDAAKRGNLSMDCLVLEVAEGEFIQDRKRFARLVEICKSMGIKMAIDDFGAGYSGLNLLADFQPDQIKLDKELVKDISSCGPRQVIVRALIQVCKDLAIELVAEGVETNEEYQWLASEGIFLFQGYLFARPGFQCFPSVSYADLPQVL